MLGQFYLGMQMLALYVDPNAIENKNILKYPCPTETNTCEILIIDT